MGDAFKGFLVELVLWFSFLALIKLAAFVPKWLWAFVPYLILLIYYYYDDKGNRDDESTNKKR